MSKNYSLVEPYLKNCQSELVGTKYELSLAEASEIKELSNQDINVAVQNAYLYGFKSTKRNISIDMELMLFKLEKIIASVELYIEAFSYSPDFKNPTILNALLMTEDNLTEVFEEISKVVDKRGREHDD